MSVDGLREADDRLRLTAGRAERGAQQKVFGDRSVVGETEERAELDVVDDVLGDRLQADIY